MLEQQPKRPSVLQLMSRLRAKQQLLEESIDFLNKAIGYESALAARGQLNQELGYLFLKFQQFDEAAAAFHQSNTDGHQPAINHHNLAVIQRSLGNLDKAEQLFRENIEHYPDCTLSYSALCSLRSFPADDPLFDQLHRQLENPNVSEKNGPLYFSLGKLYAGIGEHEAAFHHFQRGNHNQNKPFNWQQNHFHLEQVKEAYRLKVALAASSTTDQPIFIVGMPRSGTSLTEQILASHPAIFGAGETSLIHGTYIDCLRDTASKTYPLLAQNLRPTLLDRLAESVLQKLAKLNGHKSSASRYLDKMPSNFVHIGLIFQLFPNAKIVHTVRNPLDTSLSCYFTNFTDKQEWSFNLDKIGRVYRDYLSLMEFWHQRFPGKILDVDYEQLVLDQETQTRQLVEFVDLEWDSACLNFHNTERPVHTASFAQVRQPIYSSSLGRWKSYARQLKPVADILGIDISAEIEAQAEHSAAKQ